MKKFFVLYEGLFLKALLYGLLLGFIINFLFKDSVMTQHTAQGKIFIHLSPFEYVLEFMHRSILIALLVLGSVVIFKIIDQKKEGRH